MVNTGGSIVLYFMPCKVCICHPVLITVNLLTYLQRCATPIPPIKMRGSLHTALVSH
jgi:hypothetical protein